ncbi:MAG: hypothetical protein DRJ10_06955 [Bacteroidetes bacterium]|nr:MAG: hypothetical protein DRJ10_06955 [Bacteroidota bacterium]
MENMDEQNENTATGGDSANDDKLIGILSYFGILWIVAYILYGKKKSEYNVFHLRQGLGIFILLIANMIIGRIPFIGWLSIFIWIAIMVFAIMGIIGAAKGEQKELPLIGGFISENLKSFK